MSVFRYTRSDGLYHCSTCKRNNNTIFPKVGILERSYPGSIQVHRHHPLCNVPHLVDPLSISGFQLLDAEDQIRIKQRVASRKSNAASKRRPVHNQYFALYKGLDTDRTTCSACPRKFAVNDAIFCKTSSVGGRSQRHTVSHVGCIQQYAPGVIGFDGFNSLDNAAKAYVISHKRNLVDAADDKQSDEKETESDYEEFEEEVKNVAEATNAVSTEPPSPVVRLSLAPPPVQSKLPLPLPPLQPLPPEETPSPVAQLSLAPPPASAAMDLEKPDPAPTKTFEVPYYRFTGFWQKCCGHYEIFNGFTTDAKRATLEESIKISECKNCGALVCRWCAGADGAMLCKKCVAGHAERMEFLAKIAELEEEQRKHTEMIEEKKRKYTEFLRKIEEEEQQRKKAKAGQ